MAAPITVVSKTNLDRETSCTKNTTIPNRLYLTSTYFRHRQADKIVPGSFMEDINTNSTSFSNQEMTGWVLFAYQEGKKSLVMRG